MFRNEDKRTTNYNNDSVELIWMDISHRSKISQIGLCSLFVFIFYVMYGYLQEYMFSLDGFKAFGWYLTLVQFMYLSALGWIELLLRQSQRLIPLKTYAILAFLTVGTLGFSNSSLKYLNYPTQVIFKSCKLIPVMIGGILIQKKEYKAVDYMASCCMCLGLIVFTLADSRISPTFSILGVLMISCALLCDAAIGNVQEKAMKNFKAPNFEIIFYSYFIGFFYLLFILLVDGDLLKGYSFCYQKPVIYFYAFLFSLCGYLGVQVVLTLVRSCGALTAVTITNCRKVVSIIISFMFFEKPFTYHYVWAGLLILFGIYLNVFSKNKAALLRIFKGLIPQRSHGKSALDVV